MRESLLVVSKDVRRPGELVTRLVLIPIVALTDLD